MRLIDTLRRELDLSGDVARVTQTLVDTEWLVTNGLGGYASGTMAGVITRRYHGMLVAALPNPLGRTVMLNHLSERIDCGDGRTVALSGERAAERVDPATVRRIAAVHLEAELPM